MDRRTLIARAGAFAAGAGWLMFGPGVARPAGAETTADTIAAGNAAQSGVVPTDAASLLPSPRYEEALSTIVGGGTPIEGRVVIELPEDAENGSIVPYKISIESPMTADDYIAQVHLLSTQNPQPAVAVFYFTPMSGRATVAGRMRLAKTQEVVAVALTSSNSLLIGRQTVIVGIGGCGTE